MSSYFLTDGYYLFLNRKGKVTHRKIDELHPCPNIGMEIPADHPDGGNGAIALAAMTADSDAGQILELACQLDEMSGRAHQESGSFRNNLDACLDLAFTGGKLWRLPKNESSVIVITSPSTAAGDQFFDGPTQRDQDPLRDIL